MFPITEVRHGAPRAALLDRGQRHRPDIVVTDIRMPPDAPTTGYGQP